MAEKWMQEVNKKIEKKGTKGSFRRYCISKGYKGVTAACIAEGLRSKNPTVKKRANLARTFAKFRKK